MKTSGYFTPVRIVFWVIMLPIPLLVIYSLFDSFLNPHQDNDRAGCFMQQRNIQQAIRSYAGMNSLKPGDPIDWSKLIGPGLFIERTPVCPVNGASAYTFSKVVPPTGTLAAPCKDPAHKPPNIEDW